MIISGWDLSSYKVAVVYTNPEDMLMNYMAFEWEHKDTGARALQGWRAARKFCKSVVGGEPHYAFVEEPFIHRRNARGVLPLAYVNGAVRASLLSTESSVELVANKAWKKPIVGNGNATKDQIAQWLKLNYPEASSAFDGDQDLTDAACVLLFGAKTLAEKGIL